MKGAKGGRGRPATLTEASRQAQLRDAQAAHRARAADSGKVRLEANVDAKTKASLEAYRQKHGHASLGAALDAILSDL